MDDTRISLSFYVTDYTTCKIINIDLSNIVIVYEDVTPTIFKGFFLQANLTKLKELRTSNVFKIFQNMFYLI